MFPAFLDTCVLYSATLRDTLLRIAESGAFRPQWSAGVWDELRAVLVREAGLPLDRGDRLIGQMRSAFPEAEVTDYLGLVDAMACHRQGPARAGRSGSGGSRVLVTFNEDRRSGTDHALTVLMFPAFLDTCVLYSATLRDTLLADRRGASLPTAVVRQCLLDELRAVLVREKLHSRSTGPTDSSARCDRRSRRPRSPITWAWWQP